MKYAVCALIVASVATLVGCGQNSAPEAKQGSESASPGITLSADDIKGLGLSVQPASTAEYVPSVTGYGEVVSMETLAQIDADLVTAEATAAQSASAARRARDLSTGDEAAISREQLETAQSKAAADQAALVLASRKADSSLGVGARWRDSATRTRIMAALSSGHSALIRATFPLGALPRGIPQRISVSPLGQDASNSSMASMVWEAPANANFPGRSFFVLVDSSALSPGERVTVSAPIGTAQPGVFVPASALVLSESEPWLYVQLKSGTFLREPMDISHPMPGGYFMPSASAIKPGQGVVTSGAGLLLAHEANPSTEPAD